MIILQLRKNTLDKAMDLLEYAKENEKKVKMTLCALEDVLEECYEAFADEYEDSEKDEYEDIDEYEDEESGSFMNDKDAEAYDVKISALRKLNKGLRRNMRMRDNTESGMRMRMRGGSGNMRMRMRRASRY